MLKVGDKVVTTKFDPFYNFPKGTKGEVIEVDLSVRYPYGVLIDGCPLPVKFGDDEIELDNSIPKKSSQSLNKAWEKQMDSLINSSIPKKDTNNCTHKFIIVGKGIYGDYWNCKYCDMKKEDYEEELKKWDDIPF